MFKLNLKIALRNLWKNKGFSLINIGGLAIGLASCMILLLYVSYEWGYDKQFAKHDQTYVVYNNQTTPSQIFSFNSTPGVLADEIRTKTPGVARVSKTSYSQNMMLSREENKFKERVIFADGEFLNIFNYPILKGNPQTLLKNPNGVIISEELAKSLFGEEDAVNKAIKLDNKEELVVEAVMKDVPVNSTLQFSAILTWALYEKLNPWTKESRWGSNFCMTFVQLQNNALFEKANQQVNGIVKSFDKTTNNELFLHPFTKWHLYDKFEAGKNIGGRIDELKIFFLLAFCILLVACVNFMNLSTAKSEKRAKEVGVRKAIGSSRSELIKQFMLESILLSIFAMFFGFILIEFGLPYFNKIIGIQLEINYKDYSFWLTLIGLTLFTGLLAGSYPAFYLSSFAPIKVLKGFLVQGKSSLSIRKFLVVFQFGFAACLIVCTTVIYQQINYIKNKPIGFSKDNLVEIPIEGEFTNPSKREVLKDQLIKSGAAVAVTSFSRPIASGGNNTYGISWPGKGENDIVLVNSRFASYDFTKTTGIELVSGRDFSPNYGDSTNVLINETFAKIIGAEKPVGTILDWGGTKVTVIGVIKNYVMESPYEQNKPLIIGMNEGNVQYLIVKSNPSLSATASVAKLDEVLKEMNPQYPVDRKFVFEEFETKFKSEKILGTLANWFGGFAIFISCLGLLGLALYLAEQRKKEISIRKVLGANTFNILTLLNKDFIKLVIIANVIAFPLAYIIIQKWLGNYEYKVSFSFLPFALAIGLSLVVAILTISVQSLKVVKANPIDALKYE